MLNLHCNHKKFCSRDSLWRKKKKKFYQVFIGWRKEIKKKIFSLGADKTPIYPNIHSITPNIKGFSPNRLEHLKFYMQQYLFVGRAWIYIY
jgi:hypothetical protein